MMSVRLCEDSGVWNQAVLGLNGTLYHSWAWGEVRRADGWIPWRVLAESDGEPCAAIQIVEKRLPLGGYSVLYALRGIEGNGLDRASVSEIVSWLRRFTHERRGILLRMDPEFPEEDKPKSADLIASGMRSLPDQWSFWNLPRATMVVDISAPEEEVLKRMRKTHRQLIRKPAKEELLIEEGSGREFLEEFYSLVYKSSQRQKFLLRDQAHFEILREKLAHCEQGRFFLARQGCKALAAIFCVCFGRTCHYIHGGFDPEIKAARPTEILHWKAIQWAKRKGCTRYDLLGSGTSYPPQEGKRGYGLYNYKKGFGADLHYSAGYFDLVGRPVAYQLLRFAEQHPRLITTAINVGSRFGLTSQ